MAKKLSNRKRQKLERSTLIKQQKEQEPPSNNANDNDDSSDSDADNTSEKPHPTKSLEPQIDHTSFSSTSPPPPPPQIVIDYLTLLSQHTSSQPTLTNPLTTLLQTPPFRALRTSLHPILACLATQTYTLPDFQSIITTSLKEKQPKVALLALKGVRDYGLGSGVKQGTVQRWVRFVDGIDDDDDEGGNGRVKNELLAGILSISGGGGGGGGGENKHDPLRALLELDADDVDGGSDANANANSGSSVITSGGIFRPPISKHTEPTPTPTPQPTDDDIQGTSALEMNKDYAIVHCEASSTRRPPNKHDLKIYMLKTPVPSTLFKPRAGVSVSDSGGDLMVVEKHVVPGVPGAFILTNVLSARECEYIISTSEQLSYTPDHPVTETNSSGIDSCEWLAPDVLVSEIFERCKSLLPVTINEVISKPPTAAQAPSSKKQMGMGRVTSINQRFRLFRYGPNGVYRSHIDGSWPSSGINPATGMYENDKDSDRRSRLTFLIYLNDGFDGGFTTFYIPTASGGLESIKVEPRRGGVLVFPQGNVASLLHEGSQVLGGGVKYVVRSDVMFFDE